MTKSRVILAVLAALAMTTPAAASNLWTLQGGEVGLVIPDDCAFEKERNAVHCLNERLNLHAWVDPAPRSVNAVQRHQYDVLHSAGVLSHMKNFRSFMDQYASDVNAGKYGDGWFGAEVQQMEDAPNAGSAHGVGWATSHGNIVYFFGGLFDSSPDGTSMHSFVFEFWTNGSIVFVEAEFKQADAQSAVDALYGVEPSYDGIMPSAHFVGPSIH